MISIIEKVYAIFADLVFIFHFLYILFIVLGQIYILLGVLFNWGFVRNLWFRLIHLGGIIVVSIQEFLDLSCPLTLLEDYLNRLAGKSYEQDLTFLGRLLNKLIYQSVPNWLLSFLYIGFGLIVLLTFLIFPPLLKSKKLNEDNRLNQRHIF